MTRTVNPAICKLILLIATDNTNRSTDLCTYLLTLQFCDSRVDRKWERRKKKKRRQEIVVLSRIILSGNCSANDPPRVAYDSSTHRYTINDLFFSYGIRRRGRIWPSVNNHPKKRNIVRVINTRNRDVFRCRNFSKSPLEQSCRRWFQLFSRHPLG